VVEDDGLICLLLEDLLLDLGFHVVGPVHTSEAAETIVADQRLDFAILDITLRDGTSYGAAETLRRREIPFAFLTGHDTSRLRDDMRCVPVLPKPFAPETLEQMLRANLPSWDRAA
jgi:DNA-binding response OmpR family regulator